MSINQVASFHSILAKHFCSSRLVDLRVTTSEQDWMNEIKPEPQAQCIRVPGLLS